MGAAPAIIPNAIRCFRSGTTPPEATCPPQNRSRFEYAGTPPFRKSIAARLSGIQIATRQIKLVVDVRHIPASGPKVRRSRLNCVHFVSRRPKPPERSRAGRGRLTLFVVRYDDSKREARRGGHRAFKVHLNRRGRTAGVGGTGGESAALKLKKPWTEKESPGPPCPGLAVTRSPVFVARISLMRKMVKRGKTTATKWHSLQNL